MALTVREQLARQVAEIRAGTTPTTRVFHSNSAHGNRIIQAAEVTLTCRCDTLRKSVTNNIWGRVNVAEIGGAGAEHLLFAGSRTLVEYPNGLPTYRLTVRLQYADRPWNPPGLSHCPYLTADFDALLDALDPGATGEPPPEREKTWHDRPGLL
jgi:hypothetical protein